MAQRAEVGGIYLALVLGMGSFSDGFALLLQSGALLSIVPYFKLSSLATGLLISAPFIGSVAGALVFGWLADRIGRRAVVLNVLIFFVAASILSGLSINIQMLLVSRFLVGIGIGGDVPASGSLIAERAEAAERGPLLSTQTLMWAVGAASATFVAIPLLSLGALAWRPLLMLAALPPLITLMLRRRIGESIRWHSRRSSGASAARVTSRRAIYLAALLSIGLFVWTMVLAVFASYLPSLLVKIYGLPAYESLLIGAVQWICYMAGCLVAFRTVDVIGRRRLVIASTTLAILAVAAIYLVSGGYGAMTAGVLAIWGTGGVAYTGISIYSFEIPPTIYRGLLSGMVFGSGRLGGYVGTLTFPTLIGYLGLGRTIGLMGPFMLLVTIAFASFSMRTERIELERIEQLLGC